MNSTSISRSSSLTNTASATISQRGSSSNLPADGNGPLPPGWQMSKNEVGRVFFIDHINKRTTWVCYRIFCKRKIKHKKICLQIDPRTGKTTVSPSAQNDLSENGPLPVRNFKDFDSTLKIRL